MSIYSTRKSKTQKNGPSGAPGPASASPWRAKRGTLPKLSTFLLQLKRPFGEKTNFRKKVSQCRKTERGTLWGFLTSILSQNIKKLKGENFYFRKKSLAVPKKNWKGGPFGIFQHPFCRKTAKKLKGEPFEEKIFSGKKVRSAEKKIERETLWSRPVWYVTRENRKNLFGSVR